MKWAVLTNFGTGGSCCSTPNQSALIRIGKLIGFAGIHLRKARFPDIAIHAPERHVSASEIGVNLDGAIEKGHGGC